MSTTTRTLTAREIRSGDILFGMTIKEAHDPDWMENVAIVFDDDVLIWIDVNTEVTVERPAPSDPIGTVRAEFFEFDCLTVCRKVADDEWYADVHLNRLTDADVADFLILWKPGMPLPERATA